MRAKMVQPVLKLWNALEMAKITNWPKEYLAEIRAGNEVVCNKIRAVYERECQWMDKPPDEFPFEFDAERGQRHIDFIERFCKQSKGRRMGQPLRLELFQKAKLQLVFGWVEKKSRLRRIREVVDLRGRKCGKSVETAAVETDVLMNDKEGGAEIYCTANKLDQAKIIFDEAVNMRAQSSEIKAVTRKRQADIYFPYTFGFIKALASDSKTMDGLNAHFFSLDEFHEAKNRKVYDVMKQSQSAREQPLAWLISTNGFLRDCFFDEVYRYASSVAMWDDGFEDYTMLPLIHELDSRDEWTKPECWAKANPGLGKIKSLKTLEENVQKAKRDPSFLPTVLTKDFNIPENVSDRWLTYDAAVNTMVVPIEYLAHSYAIGGCDLSATTDLTCATLLIRKPHDDNVYVLQKYFLPKSRVDRVTQTNTQEARYKQWEEQGWLKVCDGAQVQYSDVTAWFLEMVNEYDIRPLWVCYDAALSGYWVPEMESYGFDMEKIRQGSFTWTYPMKDMGAAFEAHKVIYQNNPMLRWCLMNTGKKTMNKSGIESIEPVKASANLRIDGMVSLLNAWVGYQKHMDEYLPYIR